MGGAPRVDALRLRRTLHSASSVCVCLCDCVCVCGRDSVEVFISSGSGSRPSARVGCPRSAHRLPPHSPPPNRAVAVGQTTFLEYRTPGFKGLLHMLPLGPAWHLLDRIRWVFLLFSQRCAASVTGASDWHQSSDLFIFSFVLSTKTGLCSATQLFFLTFFLWLVANKFKTNKSKQGQGQRWSCVFVTALVLIKFWMTWLNQLECECVHGWIKQFLFFQVTWVIPAVSFRWRSARGGVLQVTAFIHLHWPQRKCARSYYQVLGSSPVLGSAQRQPGIVRKMFSDIWVGQDGLWLNLGVHCNVLAAGSWANFMTALSHFPPSAPCFSPDSKCHRWKS